MTTASTDRTPSAGQNAEHQPSGKPARRIIVGLAVPLILLAAVIALFVGTDGAGLNVKPVVPIETMQFGRTVLEPDRIELHLRNTSPQAVTITQVNINDAFWPFTLSGSRTVSRLGSTVVSLNYPWIEGEAYDITLFSSNSIPFRTSIPVATTTARASGSTLLSFTLIGLYVGVIPVILGMFWLPVLKDIGQRTLLFLTSATVGLLIFLGVDATTEAFELGAGLGGAFQGTGIVAIGIIATWLLLAAIGSRQATARRNEAAQRLSLATVIATGIGLHNLGEGLAIGAAYSVGAAALGTFLVIGFIIQNITEGLGIIIPIAKDKPTIRSLAVLGLIGGAPAIAGAWIGGLIYSQALSVLFLAIGAGAVFQVAYELARQMIWKNAAARQMPLTAFGGIFAGMMVLYVTGLAIK